jgi:hypothetical protein
MAMLGLAALGMASTHATAGDGPAIIVPLDVDLYAQPGGVGSPIGGVAGGTQANLIEERSDDWCHIYALKGPTERGWIWCGVGNDKQDYSLKPFGTP